MNYQSKQYQDRPNRLIIAKPQDYQQIDHSKKERSNSNKKIIFIRRKVSISSSNIHDKNDNNKIEISQDIASEIKESLIKKQKQTNDRIGSKNNKRNENELVLTSGDTRFESDNTLHPNQRQVQSSGQRELKASRGQFYEEQLDSIQKDLQFFRYQLEITQQKNRKLQNKLQQFQNHIQSCVQNIYTSAHIIFSSISSTSAVLDQFFPSLLQKKHFKSLIQKNILSLSNSLSLNQLQNDVIFIFESLNSAFQVLNQSQLIFKSHQIQIQTHQTNIQTQQMKIKDSVNQINFLNNQNQKIKSECKNLQKIISQSQKFKLNNFQIQTFDSAVKQVSKQAKQQKITAQSSRQDLKTKTKNAEVQTQERRIGSAASIHKYQSYRFHNMSKSIQSQKNQLNSSKILTDSKQLKLRLRQQPETVKKIKFEPMKQKVAIQQKKPKPINKKKGAPTSSYLNHLIQSQKFIKADETVQTIDFEKKDSQLVKQSQNAKSQLLVRRPIHRSRSHSQQEVPSSGQKSEGRKCSINNISSRVYSTYSLNPFNKYGEKRLCNEVNTRKIRKITQLSQQSEDIQNRMKELMEEENLLQQKYKKLQTIKVSRQNKKSRQNYRFVQNKTTNLSIVHPRAIHS